ncbi:hypothetical protein, partial [Dickeya dadantii]|uniref:hypothetical protein n=1 Tax=Dickeya dadantii TaxID=204038 RepID=UPI001C12F01D
PVVKERWHVNLSVVRAMKWQGSTIAYPARNHSPLRHKFASNQNNPAVCQQPQPRGRLRRFLHRKKIPQPLPAGGKGVKK